MKLLVRNLAKATTEQKILTLFKEQGSVQSCNLVLDKATGESKGFAFVEMPKAGEAKAAIKQLNGYKLAGNLIRVKKAEVKKETEETKPSSTPKVKPIIKPQATAIAENKQADKMVDPSAVWGEVKE